MAERRMFSKRVVNTAKFLKMPPSSQALYFHLGIEADDDGVCEAFPVMRMTGATEDDLRILISKKFIIPLNEELVCYITDWNENNKIRSDRKVDSLYQSLLIKVLPDVEIKQKTQRADQKKALGQPMDVQWTTNGQPMDRIGKDSIGKDSIEENTYTVDDLTPKTEPKPKSTTRKVNHPTDSSQKDTAEKPIFIEFPLLGGKSVGITYEWVEEMQKLYGQGGVDVKFEIQRAKNWCINNKKYKTLWAKFLTNWFDHCVSRGGSNTGPIVDEDEESKKRRILEEAKAKKDRELQDLLKKLKEGIPEEA